MFLRQLPMLRGYALLVCGTAAIRLLSLVTAVVLARQLRPDQFGAVALFLTLVGLWTNGDFLDSTYVRHATRQDSLEGSSGLLRGVYTLKVMWNGILIAVAIPIAWLASYALLRKPVLFAPIAFSFACAPGLNLLSFRAALFQARERFLQFAGAMSIFYALTFLAVVPPNLLFDELSTYPTYVSFFAVAVAVGLYSRGVLHRAGARLLFDARLLKRLVRFARWLFGANLIYMVAQRLDLLLVAALAPLSVVGDYGVALRVVVVVSLLSSTLAPVLLPRASSTEGSPRLIRSYLAHSAVLAGAVAVAVAVAWVCAPFAVTTVFGSEYSGAVGITRVLLFATLSIALYTPLSQLFLIEQEPRKMLYLSIVRVVAIASAGAALVPQYGGVGAAIAVAAAEWLALVFVLLATRTHLRAALRRPDPADVLRPQPARADTL
jgi:O-antigen/teichoic acid export membrane protein